MKGGAPAGNRHGVDAISGGTITSRGVEGMLRSCFTEYLPFFEKMKIKRVDDKNTVDENTNDKNTDDENVDDK
jgi:Na+-transporting NADH:ubiquinone oxidoreductase subunit NqrC